MDADVDDGFGLVEYGVCKHCAASTILCPTTMTEDGLECPDCIIARARLDAKTAPVRSRIQQLLDEREHARRRIGHIGRELRDLKAKLRRDLGEGGRR